jgi:hypothetical protein
METEASSVANHTQNAKAERPPVREEMRGARGLFVGLALSAIFWLGLFVVWLAF